MALDLSAIGRPIGPIVREYAGRTYPLRPLGGRRIRRAGLHLGEGSQGHPHLLRRHDLRLLLGRGETFEPQPEGALHGEQEILFHNPIPVSGTLTTNGTITNCFDKGKKGAVIRGESVTCTPAGQSSTPTP